MENERSVVFLLLFVLSCCAFMVGFGMSAAVRNWIYIVAFALVMTLTIYATLEIEFPRRGPIRLNNTDQALIGLRNSMK